MNEFDRQRAEELRDWVLVEEAVDTIAEKTATTPDAIWLPVLLRAQQLSIGDQAKIQAAITGANLGKPFRD